MQGTPISAIRKRNEEISRLTNNINNSIDSDNEMVIDENISVGESDRSEMYKRKYNNKPIEEDDEEEYEEYFEGSYNVPKIVREGLLLVFIYLLLSTDIAFNLAENHMPFFNVDSEGNVSMIGKLVFSIFITLVFFVSRHFVL